MGKGRLKQGDTILFGLKFLAAGPAREHSRQPAGRGTLVKTFLAVLATLLLVLALVGFWGNIQFMRKGEGLPAEPAARQGFIIGMFAVPTALLAGGVVCGALAGRQR